MTDRVIQAISDRIEERFGKTFKKLGPEVLLPLPAISTGSLLLNEALNESKGYPEGCCVEIFGPQHSGKTLMGLLAIAESQKKHPERPCLIVDAERQFLYQAKWAKQLGVNVEELYHTNVTSAEEAFEKIEAVIQGEVEFDKREGHEGQIKKIINPGHFGVILIDSVSQLVPLEEIHKAMDASIRMAAMAAAIGRGLRKVISAQSLVDSKTTLIFINQTRSNPGAKFGTNPETRSGGNALPFYNTIAFRVSKVYKSEERDERNKIFSHRVKVRMEKNKTGQMPADVISFKIRYDGTGVDNNDELIGVALMNQLVIKVKKGQYNFVKPGTEELLDNTIENFKQEDFSTILEKHPKMKEIVLDYIKNGAFYFNDSDLKEDNPDVSEQTLQKEPEKIDKPIESVEKKVEVEKWVEQPEEKIEEKVDRRKRRKVNVES